MGRRLTRSIRPPTSLAELRQQEQEAWNNVSQDDIRHLHDRLHARVQAYVYAQGGYVAATRGSLHVAPLPGNVPYASHHINTAPAPGTI